MVRLYSRGNIMALSSFRFAATFAALTIAVAAYAQDVNPAAAAQSSAPVAPVAAPAPASRVVPPSTVLSVTPLVEITSKRIEEGDKFQFSVVADVVEGGVVAIPRGTLVQGTITWKTGRAIGGKSGKFEVTFDHVTVHGKNYKLTGLHRQEGRGNSVGALLGSMVVSGRSAVMLPGQMANAITAEPIPF
jgi:hypothetical protein